MTGAVFHRLAERELEEAVDHYDEAAPGLGQDFLAEVRRAIDLLARHPQLASRLRSEIRRFVLDRFPYSLLYRHLSDGTIRILAVAHHKRRPSYWVGRS